MMTMRPPQQGQGWPGLSVASVQAGASSFVLGRNGGAGTARSISLRARAIAFVALEAESGAMMGAVRLQADAAHETGEYAILVRSDLKGIGLGWRLMQLMVEWARAEGLRVVEGQVLRENTVMLDMCRRLGFAIRTDPNDPDIMVVKLALDRKRDADVSPP